jgi:hypothetical protein
VGFSASHSMGLILFGLVFGFLARGSQLGFISVAVPAGRRAGHAWWFCCAQQGLFFQCAFQRRQPFFGLLHRQYCAIAGLTMRRANR